MENNENGRQWVLAHLRLCDTIVRGNNGRRGSRRRASERVFHPSETFRRYDIFGAITISWNIPALLRIELRLLLATKNTAKLAAIKSFRDRKTFIRFPPVHSCPLPPVRSASRAILLFLSLLCTFVGGDGRCYHSGESLSFAADLCDPNSRLPEYHICRWKLRIGSCF